MNKKLIVTLQLEIELDSGSKPNLAEVAEAFENAVNSNPRLAAVAWGLGTYLDAKVTNITKISSLDV